MDEIGNKIYQLRKEKGLSQEDLAERIGVSRQTVYNWESDSVKPNNENIKILCKVLCVGMEYFYGTQYDFEHVVNRNLDKNIKIKGQKIIALLFFVFALFIVNIFLLVWSGFAAFTYNVGDNNTSSLKNCLPMFVSFLVFSILLLMLLTFLIFKLIYIKKQLKNT